MCVAMTRKAAWGGAAALSIENNDLDLRNVTLGLARKLELGLVPAAERQHENPPYK